MSVISPPTLQVSPINTFPFNLAPLLIVEFTSINDGPFIIDPDCITTFSFITMGPFVASIIQPGSISVSYTHLRAHET